MKKKKKNISLPSPLKGGLATTKSHFLKFFAVANSHFRGLGGKLFLTLFLFFFCVNTSFSQDWKYRKDLPEEYPTPPKTETRLFYIQRNLNRNTIAYDLNLKSNGQIDEDKPIDNYWMRYTGDRGGIREELGWFEKKMAYGYSSNKNEDGTFTAKLVAYKDRKVTLKKVNGKWIPMMRINGKDCQLTLLYVYADQSGMMPDVKYVDLFGKDLDTKKSVVERFYVD